VIHVLVVSENRLHGEGLTLRLSAEPGIRAIGPRERIPDALSLTPGDEVDIVLVDVEATPANQQDLAEAVAAAPGLPFVTLATAESDWEIVAWAEAGAYSIVDRKGSPGELATILQSVAEGEARCSPRIAGALLRCVQSLLKDGRPVESWSRLTRRERDVLLLIGNGLSNKEIARYLGLQLPTVKNHVHSIYEKLEVTSRAMAVSQALSAGDLRNNGAGGHTPAS
jgi:DNA-binding NarL/FixJ family response regulator